MAHSWQNPGSYTVRIQTKDIKGAISGWSDEHQILISQISNNPPNKPSAPSGPSIGFEESTYVFLQLHSTLMETASQSDLPGMTVIPQPGVTISQAVIQSGHPITGHCGGSIR